MSQQRDQVPNQELDTGLDTGGGADIERRAPEDGMRRMPTDPPAVVPGAASEQMPIAAGMGLSGFAKSDPEGGLTGASDEDDLWTLQPPTDRHDEEPT